jgi:hypothetical protein
MGVTMAEAHRSDTPRARGDTSAPHMSPVTPAEDARTILINKISWGAVLAGPSRTRPLLRPQIRKMRQRIVTEMIDVAFTCLRRFNDTQEERLALPVCCTFPVVSVARK